MPLSQVTYHVFGGRHRGKKTLDSGGIVDPAFPVEMQEIDEANAKPFTDRLIDLVDGLREGMKLMAAGDQVQFWIPPNLAFDDQFALGGSFYPHDVLMLHIKLLSFEKLSEDELKEIEKEKEDSNEADCDENQVCSGAFIVPFV